MILFIVQRNIWCLNFVFLPLANGWKWPELPTVVVEVDAFLGLEAVILQGTYEENNSEDPVIRFYVTVSDHTMTATPADEMSSFSVTLNYGVLEEGVTYTVHVLAENVIGNGTLQSPQTFTVPGNQVHIYTQFYIPTHSMTISSVLLLCLSCEVYSNTYK